MSFPDTQNREIRTQSPAPDGVDLYTEEGESCAVAECRPHASSGQNARSTFRFSLQHLNSAISYCRPEVRQLVREGYLWCIAHEVSVDEWARAIGMPEVVFYRFLTGRYVHPQTGIRLVLPEENAQALRRWLKEQKAALGHSIGEDEFVETPTAKRA
jgi:hypothetical protein